MKKTVLILVLLFCSLFTKTHAQFYEPDAESLQLLNSADYIFEGMVLDSKPYYHVDGTKILTTCTVKVTSVYKGNLEEGTIELIREYGSIGMDYQYDSHMVSIGYNTTTVFVCKKSNYESVSKNIFENKNKVSLVNEYQGTIRYTESETGKMSGLNEIYFNTKQDFELFLQKVKGVKISNTTARRSQEKRPSFEEFMEEQNQRVAIAKNNAKNNPKKKAKANRTAAATNDLKITLANATITNTGTIRFFEFDIMASANNSTTYFSNAIIRLDFNSTAFGSNIASTAGSLLLTNGSAFPVSQYVNNQYDVNPSRINIALGDNSAKATTWNRTQLTTTPIVLLHAKIKVVGCDAILGITSFVETTYTPLFSLYTATAVANWKSTLSYTNTYYTNTLANTIGSNAKINGTKLATSSALCSSGFSFSPAKIHSGNNQVLTITGKGFGTIWGNVLFQNADSEIKVGNDNYLKGLDNNYIKSWTDTKIEVYVPSKVTEGGITSGAASGKFKVLMANGIEVTSSTALDIEYAMLNLGSGIEGDPFGKYHLARVNCVNGLTFTLHTSFNNNPDAVATVEKALKDWADKLKITLALEKDAQGKVVYESNFKAVNKNVIILDPNYLDYGKTSVVPVGIETNGTAKKYYRSNADITFNANKPWHFIATGDLPAGKSDFYHAITHEIGHALGLDHAVDASNGTKDIMYYTAIRNQTQIIPAAQRINLNTYGTRAVNGAIAKIAIDKATSWTTPTIATLGTTPVLPTIKASEPGFCKGGSVTLTASPATNYLWSNGATTSSIVVSTPGAYSVTTTSGGCSATSVPVTVVVIDKPAIPTIKASGSTSLCKGGSVTLSASPAANYLWSNGATTSSIVVSTAGAFSVTTTNRGCSSTSLPVTVIVNENPKTPWITASGPTSFCKGGSVILTANPAANYLWSNGATSNRIVVSTSGTFSVTTTNSAGCISTSPATTVIVSEKPVITKQPINATTCATETVSFSLTATGTELKYQWQSSSDGVNYTNIINNTTFSGALTNTLVLNKPALSFNNWFYRCVVTNGTCATITSSAVKHTMTVVALARLNSVFKTTPAFALSGGSPSGGTYSGTGVSNGVFNPANLAPGSYTITYTKNTCSPTTATQNISVIAPVIDIYNLSNTTFKLSTTTVAKLSIDFSALGTYTAGNKFIAQLSDATGSFTNPVNIGTITGVSSGKIEAIIPNTTTAGSGYKIRVVSTTPVVIGRNNPSIIAISKATQKTSELDKIESQNEESILYPNPATDKLNISVSESSFDTKGNVNIVIFDINGKIVKQIQSQLLITTIDVSDINDGIYILKIGENDKGNTKKLIVKHN